MEKLKEKKSLLIILSIVVLIMVLVLLKVFVFKDKNLDEQKTIKANKKVIVENNSVSDVDLLGLKFDTKDENGQLVISVTNTKDEDIYIKKFIITLTAKKTEERPKPYVDKAEIKYDDVLMAGSNTNITLGNDINNIESIDFNVETK